MVSIGTIFSLVVVGAIAAGGYALYRNADKVGGALSRGVETNLTNPLGNYFDNLFTNPVSAVVDTVVDTITQAKPQSKTTKSPDPKVTPILIPGQVPVATTIGRTTTTRPSTVNPAGYYYFDVAGSKYDTQQLLSIKQATDFKAAAVLDPALLNVRYLGKSKLSPAGFNLFGKTQGYL